MGPTREVCALIFFRYGITPTGNKLYQLVRKGRMRASAKALATFWSDLHEKSRVRSNIRICPRNYASPPIGAFLDDLEAAFGLRHVRAQSQSSPDPSFAVRNLKLSSVVVRAESNLSKFLSSICYL